MPLQSYKFSRGLCLNNFLQVLLIVNQRDQVPPFRYLPDHVGGYQDISGQYGG